MSVSPDVEPFIEEVWNAVLAYAGVAPDRFHLLAVPGAALTGANRAAWYPPGDHLLDDPDDLLHGALLDEANADEHRDKHRIAIYEDIDEDDVDALATLGGLLRHEIRHAEQSDACGQSLTQLNGLVDMVLGWKAGGLPGSGVYYNLKPIEVDANAASATFLQARHPDTVERILTGDWASLARSLVPPGDLADLPAKTVGFLFGFREIAEDPERSPQKIVFTERLAAIDQSYADMWSVLANRGIR